MIEITNLTTKEVDEEFLRRLADKVLAGEKKKAENLSIALIGSGRMRKLNKRFFGKNRVTDVLAFPESKVLLEKFKVGPAKKVLGLGEVVICLREVKKNSKRFKSAEEKELARVLIHGLLHVLGYDHEKGEEQAEKMKEKEELYLLKVF